MSGEREPWIAVKVGVPESPKIVELPSDAARWGLIVLWSKAKKQSPSGVFRSERLIRALLGKHAKYLPTYVEAGFLHVAPVTCGDQRCRSAYQGLDAPSIAVHSWHDYQRDHALRQLAYRVGDGASDTASDAASDFSSRAMSLSIVNSPLPEGGPGETDDPVDTYYALTTRFPRENVLSWLKDLGNRHGNAATSSMLAACYSEDRNLGTLLGRVATRLKVADHEAEQREKADEIVRNRQKREPIGWERDLRDAIARQNGESVPA